MSVKIEDLGKNMVKLTIEVGTEEVDKALESAYHKNKGKINVQGFRKGKAPRSIIEKMYGPEVFYEDAANEMINSSYEQAVTESGVEVVSRPQIDVTQIEKGKSFIYTAEVAKKPEVELGKYKGVEIDKIDVSVSDDEVNEEIDKEREKNSRTVDVDNRPAQMNDIVNIDYEGSVDGVPFDGGKAEGANLTLGSHSFIDTFEDQIVGKSIGDEFDVNVTFPEEYHAEELKGKAAVFKCKLNGITVKELPELDDDFAQDVSDFDTLSEYKEDVKKKLSERKEAQAKNAKEDAVVDKIIEDSKMDIPEPMIDLQKREMAEDFAQRLTSQGMSIDMYFKYTGMTAQQFIEQMKPQALKKIQYRLVLEAVAKAEKLEADEEEMKKELERMASQYQMEVDKLEELLGENEKKMIKEDLEVQKAIDFVRDNAVEK
ncbi:MAG: trigger factor [Lachnospiraceae bacterium]|nr:trigger factor [Lachnospiraceae bacterium]